MTDRTILVATDFSTRSDRALRRAVLLAGTMAARLLVLHAIDDDLPPSLLSAGRLAAEDLLADLCDTLRAVDGVEARCEIASGEPFDEIAAVATREEVQLCVLGPHRRHRLRDVFVGTTAERTISRATVPVLMANGAPVRTWATVLVATDLSDGSEAAIESVHRLGLAETARVVVLHVFEAPADGLLSTAGAETGRMDYLRGEEARAGADLADFLARSGGRELARDVRPAGRTTADTILEAARETGADLLVLGREGRGLVDRLVLGSVVGEVLRKAETDVLVVPPRPRSARVDV